MIAGGVGITAFVGILREAGTSSMSLYWSVRSAELVDVLREDLRAISKLGVAVIVYVRPLPPPPPPHANPYSRSHETTGGDDNELETLVGGGGGGGHAKVRSGSFGSGSSSDGFDEIDPSTFREQVKEKPTVLARFGAGVLALSLVVGCWWLYLMRLALPGHVIGQRNS
jgi:hypothetical protein